MEPQTARRNPTPQILPPVEAPPLKRKFDLLDPSELPDIYAMVCEGVCLEPEIKNGACLMFDKNAPFKVGDFVILYRRPELVRPGEHQAIVKRLVMAPPPWIKFPYREHPDSNVRALLIAEQFNPRGCFRIPCEDLLAVHKCLGPVPKGVKRIKATKDEMRSMRFSSQT